MQVAVHTEHHLIVAHAVNGLTNSGSDRAQLANIAKQARLYCRASLEAVADRGDFSSPEILAYHEADITVTLPKPFLAPSRKGASASRKGAYPCPAGEQLRYRFTDKEDGKRIERYSTTACQSCSLNSPCTTRPER